MSALNGDKALAEFDKKPGVHPNQIIEWEPQFSEVAASIFDEDETGPNAVQADETRRQAKIGELKFAQR